MPMYPCTHAHMPTYKDEPIETRVNVGGGHRDQSTWRVHVHVLTNGRGVAVLTKDWSVVVQIKDAYSYSRLRE